MRVGLSALIGVAILIAASQAAAQTAPPQRPEAAPGFVAEPRLLTKGINVVLDKFTSDETPREGFYPTFGTRMPGSGWIAIGPGFRHHFWDHKVFADVSGAISWRQFIGADARVELPHLRHDHLTVGAQVLAQDWTQIMYFGTGPDSVPAGRSQYRLRAADTSIYAMARLAHGVEMRGRIGVLGRSDLAGASGWHRRDLPNTQELFTDAQAPALGGGPRMTHGELSATIDTLNHPGHPTRGGLLQASIATFHDGDFGTYSFRRAELVALRMLPIISDRWTLAIRGTVITSSPSSGNRVPFYMMPTLGGQTLLRGFDTDRFRDRNLVALNIESRWALFTHMDAALFTDLGEVAPTIADLGHESLHSAIGAGLRIHTGVATLVRLDIAHGDEGWRLAFKLSESLTLSTIRRWATVIPIVP